MLQNAYILQEIAEIKITSRLGLNFVYIVDAAPRNKIAKNDSRVKKRSHDSAVNKNNQDETTRPSSSLKSRDTTRRQAPEFN